MHSKKGDFLPCCPATHLTSRAAPSMTGPRGPSNSKNTAESSSLFALILAFGQRGSTSMTIVVNEKQASHIHLTMSIATFETTVGTFKAELYTAQMPITWYVRISSLEDRNSNAMYSSNSHKASIFFTIDVLG